MRGEIVLIMTQPPVYWPPVCGRSSEPQNAFWSDSVTLNTTNPDFPRCFQETVLVWGLCGLFWLSTPFYLLYLSRQTLLHPWTAASRLNASKVVFSVLLVLVSLVQLINQLGQHPDNPPSTAISYGVYAATFALLTFLIRLEYCRGQHSSGLLFSFSFLLVIVNIVPLRSRIMAAQQAAPEDTFDFAAFCVFYALLVMEVLLHVFADTAALVPHQVAPVGDERRPLLADTDPTNQTQSSIWASRKPSPELSASFLSRLTFSWLTGLLVIGYKKQLDGSKLYPLRPDGRSQNTVGNFYKAWREASTIRPSSDVEPRPSTDPTYSHRQWNCGSSMGRTLWSSQGLFFSLLVLAETVDVALTFIRPTILDALIGFVESEDPFVWRGYVYAALLFAITVAKGIVNQQIFWGKVIIYVRVRSAITAAIYRKALVLASSERKNYSVGEIINLMSVDGEKIADGAFQLHNMLAAPLHIIVAMVMLWMYLGPSSLAGVVLSILSSGFSVLLLSQVKRLQVLQMKFKDKRLKLTNEVLNGIRVLKLYAWEGAFQGKLADLRRIEISHMLKAAFYVAGMSISLNCVPILFTVASFTIYILAYKDNVLSAQVAFVSLSLVGSLTKPFANLPNGVASFAQALVSMRRVETFLNKTELDKEEDKTNLSDHVVDVQNGSFSWDSRNEDSPALRNINVGLRTGSLTAVVGQVGSGKSSLLSAILGEMHRTAGGATVTGTIASVPQEAWIRNQTLKSNVLFGKSYNRGRYEEIIEACALGPDLQMLPASDQTEIGEKGINLSGGQKQRVSLARAVYQDEDVYLLDDPLSAVDVHVGKHLFEKVIGPAGLLQDKTRVLVTHGLTHLSRVDHVIVMTRGQISEQGTYEELLSHDGDFAQLVRTYLVENEDAEELDAEGSEFLEALKARLSDSSHTDEGGELRTRRLRKRKSSVQSAGQSAAREGLPTGHTKGGTLVDSERYEVGRVSFAVLLSYVRTLGKMASLGCLLAFVVQIAFDLAASIWLSEWSQDGPLSGPNITTDPNLPSLRVGVYGGLGAGKVLGILAQTLALAVASTTASQILHERLLESMMKAPVLFFDTTPTGRILNRFSQDINVVDWQLRAAADASLRGLSGILTTLVAVLYASPIFIVVCIPLGVVYYFVQRFYVMSANQVRRLVSVRSSPLYSHFGESIMGASSIRSYRRQQEYTEDCDRYSESVLEAWYLRLLTNRWLSVWLEVLGAFIVLFTAVYAVVARDSTSAGLVGLSVSYALQVTDNLSFFMKNTSDLETNIVSVERIDEYSKVKPEAPWHIPERCPPPDWPSQGNLTFSGYSTRYRPGLDLVLRQISCSMSGGQKTGIVGRTGAGKTSLTMGLFRLIEPTEGSIVIDDVNTCRIGLHDLRTKLTIIPQDPVLFSGSLRFNMDPFDSVTDGDVWDALGHAHLKDFVFSLPARLDHECGEAGLNLSVGQRQLVCLARALLRRSKILVLDEATAAVDMETDALIQNTIRNEFKDCTVITIAHRVNTVLDYDKIVVLQGGEVREYGAPSDLLGQADSVFLAMCQDAGVL